MPDNKIRLLAEETDRVVPIIASKWCAIECLDCGETIEMTDVWMLQRSRSGETFNCQNCGCMMALSNACVDGKER